MSEIHRRGIDVRELDTVLAEDFEFEGEMEFSKPLMLKGKFRGEIRATSDFIVAEGAVVEARIEGRFVDVRGYRDRQHRSQRTHRPDRFGPGPRRPDRPPSDCGSGRPIQRTVHDVRGRYSVRTCPAIFALFVAGFLLVAAFAGAQQKDALEAYKAGKYTDAVAITQDELKQNSNNMDSYVVLCWSLQKLEKHQDALNFAQQALKLNAYDFRVIEIVGESSFYLGKNLDALKAFEQYVGLAPSGDRIEKAYYFMGEIYLQLGQYNRADIALTTAVYHSPQTAAWWSRLGYARMLAKDYPSAKKSLRRSPAPESRPERSCPGQTTGRRSDGQGSRGQLTSGLDLSPQGRAPGAERQGHRRPSAGPRGLKPSWTQVPSWWTNLPSRRKTPPSTWTNAPSR